MNRIIAVVLAVLSVAVYTNASCGLDVLTKCSSPLSNLTMGTFNLTDQFVNQTCGNLGDISTCVTQAGCLDNDTDSGPAMRGIKDGFTFLCGEGRQALIANQKCLRSSDAQKSIATCSAAYTVANKANPKLLCTAANGLLACTQVSLASCPAEGSKVFVTYIYKFLQPAANNFNCTLDITTVLKLSAQSVTSSSWTLLGALLLTAYSLQHPGAQ